MTGGERERYILNVFARERERERTLECVRGLEIPAHVRILPGHQPLPRLPACHAAVGGHYCCGCSVVHGGPLVRVCSAMYISAACVVE